MVAPVDVSWSSKTYGPDGPWQAIQLQIGNPPVQIDAYPAGTFFNLVISPDVCGQDESKPFCFAREAGTYDPASSGSSFPLPVGGASVGEFWPGAQSVHMDGAWYHELISLPGSTTRHLQRNSTTMVASRAFYTLPSGRNYSAQVGNFNLGANGHTMDHGNTTGTMFSSSLYDDGQTASNSFGLHIGSADLGLPGSLQFGGYDRSRIIGPVSAQVYGHDDFPIDLLDISITAYEAGSNNPNTETGLLLEGNATPEKHLTVAVDPKEPYLFLPDGVCRSVASRLPVSYSGELGLYLWDVGSPEYERLIRTPSHLGFTFRLNSSSSETFAIKVPFVLLNLTLTEPITETPTPYFPCHAPSVDGVRFLDGQQFRLGRAFLQAAYMGANWKHQKDGVWFLAQAPGPALPSAPEILQIEDADEFLLSRAEDDWVSSWDGIFDMAALSNSENSTATAEPTPGGRNKAGLIAGIVVGVLALIVLHTVAGWWFWRKRKIRKAAAAAAEQERLTKHAISEATHLYSKAELSTEGQKCELEAIRHTHNHIGELPTGTATTRYELG